MKAAGVLPAVSLQRIQLTSRSIQIADPKPQNHVSRSDDGVSIRPPLLERVPAPARSSICDSRPEGGNEHERRDWQQGAADTPVVSIYSRDGPR